MYFRSIKYYDFDLKQCKNNSILTAFELLFEEYQFLKNKEEKCKIISKVLTNTSFYILTNYNLCSNSKYEKIRIYY